MNNIILTEYGDQNDVEDNVFFFFSLFLAFCCSSLSSVPTTNFDVLVSPPSLCFDGSLFSSAVPLSVLISLSLRRIIGAIAGNIIAAIPAVQITVNNDNAVGL